MERNRCYLVDYVFVCERVFFVDFFMATAASGFGRFMKRLTDREPVVVFSCAMGFLGIGMPLVVVPIRESMGFATDQYNGPNLPPLGGGRSSTAEM